MKYAGRGGSVHALGPEYQQKAAVSADPAVCPAAERDQGCLNHKSGMSALSDAWRDIEGDRDHVQDAGCS